MHPSRHHRQRPQLLSRLPLPRRNLASPPRTRRRPPSTAPRHRCLSPPRHRCLSPPRHRCLSPPRHRCLSPARRRCLLPPRRRPRAGPPPGRRTEVPVDGPVLDGGAETDLTSRITWRKSSYSSSSGDNCVEVASAPAPSPFATPRTRTARRWRSRWPGGRRSPAASTAVPKAGLSRPSGGRSWPQGRPPLAARLTDQGGVHCDSRHGRPVPGTETGRVRISPVRGPRTAGCGQ